MTPRLTVLMSFPTPRASSVNPYTILLAEHSHQAGHRVLYFSWRTALFANYDLMHVHWPENLVGGRTPMRRLVRQLLTVLILVRLTVTRRALVRTVHNLELPEGLSRVQLYVLRLIDRRTDFVIRLNPFTPVPAHQPFATIPHPHFRDWFANFARSEQVPGQIGYAGRIRRYKGVESLIRAFSSVSVGSGAQPLPLHQSALTVRIAGYPSSPALVETLTQLAGDDDRIALEFGFIPDSTLVDLITSSQLVVLPYRLMHNSAAALTALSLDRPVLVPQNAATRALAVEVGDGWVYTYTGELTGDDLTSTLAALSSSNPSSRARRPSPDLDARSWTRTTRSHGEAYARAVRIARYSRSSWMSR